MLGFSAATLGVLSGSHRRTQHGRMLCEQNTCQERRHSQGPQVAWLAAFVSPSTGMPRAVNLTSPGDSGLHGPRALRAGRAGPVT